MHGLASTLTALLIALTGPIPDLDAPSLFQQVDKLTLGAYTLKKQQQPGTGIEGQGPWIVVLERDGDVERTFENGWSEHMSEIGLFPLVADEGKQFVIAQYSGGAHCCYTTTILATAPELRVIHETVSTEGAVGGPPTVTDEDKDGVYEIAHTVKTFDYFGPLSHAASPFCPVIYAYNRTTGRYHIANRRFPHWPLNGIEEKIATARKLYKELPTDLTTVNEDRQRRMFAAVLDVVVAYTYGGQENAAKLFFRDYYPFDDKDTLAKQIGATFRDCPVYQAMYPW
jgi:hypothetical protein